ncbi:hypothetical protein EVAR_38292_1 [Eumeta japonica]|uniref:Uncharacterized protein n=1 Tax=Eumeta variegata TaxID=151549 RepID=A0A4C1W8E6_EUMVA|nr:hypothetical protein EVAR_38292_1 [Eumeta japonica]
MLLIQPRPRVRAGGAGRSCSDTFDMHPPATSSVCIDVWLKIHKYAHIIEFGGPIFRYSAILVPVQSLVPGDKYCTLTFGKRSLANFGFIERYLTRTRGRIRIQHVPEARCGIRHGASLGMNIQGMKNKKLEVELSMDSANIDILRIKEHSLKNVLDQEVKLTILLSQALRAIKYKPSVGMLINLDFDNDWVAMTQRQCTIDAH